MTIDSRTEWGLEHSFTIDWYVDSTDTSPSAVCYDCLCLIGFFRTVKSLFHDEEETRNHLGYVLRCLCLPLVVDGMTQSLTEFKGPGCALIVSETGYTGGRRCVCTCLTSPAICSAGGSSRPLIGRRASGGGSDGHTDCARVSGAVDISAGGIWIAYIKQALGASQLVVAAPVTGSLVCFNLFSHRDITRTVNFPWRRTAGGTDWVLQAGYQVLLQVIAEYCNMGAVSSEIRQSRGENIRGGPVLPMGCAGGSGGCLLLRGDASDRESHPAG